MPRDQCDLCHRDLSPGALTHCREADCPLKASHARASATVLLALLAMALIVAVAVALSSWLMRGRSPASDAGSTAATAVEQARATDLDRGGATVLPSGAADRRTSPDGRATPAGDATAAGPETSEAPDPRAAMRVQSFSCEGGLTASRLWICTHWSLATMDYNLALQYKAALRRSKAPQALRKAHADWLIRLDKLDGNAAGLRRAFEDWSEELGGR
jgi:hypothetical protein